MWRPLCHSSLRIYSLGFVKWKSRFGVVITLEWRSLLQKVKVTTQIAENFENILMITTVKTSQFFYVFKLECLRFLNIERQYIWAMTTESFGAFGTHFAEIMTWCSNTTCRSINTNPTLFHIGLVCSNSIIIRVLRFTSGFWPHTYVGPTLYCVLGFDHTHAYSVLSFDWR